MRVGERPSDLVMYIDWILGAVLGEQEESFAEGVDVLLGEVLEVLRHDKAVGSRNFNIYHSDDEL